MKPLGIGLGVSASGIGMSVRMPSGAEDAVWEAVQEAIDAGWTVEQFRRECAQAWGEYLREAANAAGAEWSK